MPQRRRYYLCGIELHAAMDWYYCVGSDCASRRILTVLFGIGLYAATILYIFGSGFSQQRRRYVLYLHLCIGLCAITEKIYFVFIYTCGSDFAPQRRRRIMTILAYFFVIILCCKTKT